MIQSNSPKTEGINTYLLVWTVIFIGLFATYSAAIALPFAYHDDYYFFAYDDRGSYWPHPQALFFLLVGREGYIPLAYLMAKLIHTVNDLGYVRLIFVGALALFGTMMTKFMVRCGLSLWQGVILSIMLLLSAGFQVGVLWVTMVPFVVALLLSFAGGWLALSTGEKIANRPGWLLQHILWDSKYPFVLALAATFIYQPWAMFYLLPLCAYLIFTPLGSMRRTLTVLSTVGGIFFAAIITYFVLHRYIFLPYLPSYFFPQARTSIEDPTFAFKITADLGGKINFLLHDILLHATNLWNIYLSNLMELVILFLIFSGAVAGLFRIWKQGESRKRLQEAGLRFLALAGLSVCAVLPVLVASGGHSGFRVVTPLSAMLVLMLGGAIMEMSRFQGRQFIRAELTSRAILGTVSVLAAVLAWGNVRDSALNASQEFLTVKSTLRDYLTGDKDQEMQFMLANPKYSTTLGKPVSGVGEFNVNAASFWQDVPWIVRAALLDLGVAPAQACVMTKVTERNDVPQNCIVISVVPYSVKPGGTSSAARMSPKAKDWP